jgi:hypothetical protein
MPLSKNSNKLNEILSNETRQVIKSYDSLKDMRMDSIEIRKHFFSNMNLQAKIVIDRLEKQDSLVDRIQNISMLDNKLYVTKKMKGFSWNQSSVDVIDPRSRKLLFQDVYFEGDNKNAVSKEQFFPYCLQCPQSMRVIKRKTKLCTYNLSENNFFPDVINDKKDYNTKFDKWMLDHSPYYMLLLYEIQY